MSSGAHEHCVNSTPLNCVRLGNVSLEGCPVNAPDACSSLHVRPPILVRLNAENEDLEAHLNILNALCMYEHCSRTHTLSLLYEYLIRDMSSWLCQSWSVRKVSLNERFEVSLIYDRILVQKEYYSHPMCLELHTP